MKIALVTGGSKGIGLYSVLRLVKQGYKVITCSRSKKIWLDVMQKYPELKSVDYQLVDIANEQQLDGLFAHIEAQYGKLDV
ncbi:TPA: SDR family oxidoreductase, partial [Vibrio diabolicus]